MTSFIIHGSSKVGLQDAAHKADWAVDSIKKIRSKNHIHAPS